MYACPKHVCTDHPVLVYKTCKIERTVLRLFSCLPPPLSPQSFTSLSYSSSYHKSSFGSVTSTTNILLSLLAACHKVVSLDRSCQITQHNYIQHVPRQHCQLLERQHWHHQPWYQTVYHQKDLANGFSNGSKLATIVSVKTYYCLWQAVGNDLILEVEVTDPKDY